MPGIKGHGANPAFHPGGEGVAAGGKEGSTNTGVIAGKAPARVLPLLPALSQAQSGTNSFISPPQTEELGPDTYA